MDRSFITSALLFVALICGSQMRALPLHTFFNLIGEVSGDAHGSGTVSGHAVLKDGANWQGPCQATLRKEIDRRGAPDPDQESPPDGKTSFSVPLDQYGNFQFANVPPGKHMLVVECPTTSSVRELDVQANKQTRLDAIPLEDLTLQIVVIPKLDPYGKPWQMTVDATMPRLRSIANNAATSSDGRWTHRGLAAGNYRVNISSSDGKPWLQKFFNLSASSGPLLLRLPFMLVSGQVHLNAQPVRGRLIFFNESGGEPMTLTSDETGFFRGLLPVTPGKEKTSWTIEARGVEPPISRRLSGVSVQTQGETTAWLDLTLPAFAVHGTVVSEKGQLQSGVQVTFENIGNGTRASTATDDTGAFELQDLLAGKYTVVAESVDGTSDRMPFQIASGMESEVNLRLTPSERVPFDVIARQGPVADAAVQVWIQPGQPWYFTHSDQDGHFEVKVPPGTTEVGMTIAAPGYAIKLTRVKVPTDNDSSDTNTINLDDSGGTLVLNLKPPGRSLDGFATPYLVHDKAIEAVGTLIGFTDLAGASSSGAAMVKAIEPGDYALCFLPDPTLLPALWQGGLPPDHCQKGSLKYDETLTLSPP
jgi:hypothetical protein